MAAGDAVVGVAASENAGVAAAAAGAGRGERYSSRIAFFLDRIRSGRKRVQNGLEWRGLFPNCECDEEKSG